MQARQCRHPKAENRRKIAPTLPNRRPCGHVCSSLLENEEMQTNPSGLNGPCPRQLGPPDLCRKQRHTRQGKHGLIQHLLNRVLFSLRIPVLVGLLIRQHEGDATVKLRAPLSTPRH